MERVRLIRWKPGEGEERAGQLRALGYAVDAAIPPQGGAAYLRELRDDPPAAVVIDLTRLPSHGRDVAMALREQASTRRIPIVFASGDPARVARIREQLPDATFASWEDIAPALREAIANPPGHPIVPASRLAGYSGTPLAKKLGVRAGSRLALVNEPEGFRATLGDLPEGARVTDEPAGADVVVWFVSSHTELQDDIRRLTADTGSGMLWIAWPKRASGVPTDLSEAVVREAGLAIGWVDSKIAALDATWSALRFTRRKQARSVKTE